MITFGNISSDRLLVVEMKVVMKSGASLAPAPGKMLDNYIKLPI